MISRREFFRNSHHRSEASTWRSPALGCRMISFVEPYAGSRRRLIPFRRTPRSQLSRWDLLMNAWPRVPQESPPPCECWAVAHPAFSTVRELSSQALSSGCDGHDVVERPTLRLQRVCVEYLEQRRAAVISEVPTSLASLHVAEGGRRGSREWSDLACPRIQEPRRHIFPTAFWMPTRRRAPMMLAILKRGTTNATSETGGGNKSSVVLPPFLSS